MIKKYDQEWLLHGQHSKNLIDSPQIDKLKQADANLLRQAMSNRQPTEQLLQQRLLLGNGDTLLCHRLGRRSRYSLATPTPTSSNDQIIS
ncbi:MAG: hypothetical protein ACMZI2_06880 [Candidatus Symbiodolus clandestinus]